MTGSRQFWYHFTPSLLSTYRACDHCIGAGSVSWIPDDHASRKHAREIRRDVGSCMRYRWAGHCADHQRVYFALVRRARWADDHSVWLCNQLLDIGENRRLKPAIFAAFFTFSVKLFEFADSNEV